MKAADRIGEIIETGTTFFVAASFTLHRPPALGRMVYVQHAATRTYGVVCYGTTTSPDPGRRAVRRSTENVYDDDIYREHPQLEHTLHTEFTVRLVGYGEKDRLYRYLPPMPPPLHYSVHGCTGAEVRAFTRQLTYLRQLLQVNEIPPDQLLAAHLRQVYRTRGNDDVWLAQAARQVAGLLKGDYDQLMTVLYGILPSSASAQG